MTEHFLRRKWMPSTEADLVAAYRGGLLDERNWSDLKAALDTGKGANTELARDLASFAVDGGTLIIGVDEREPGGSPLTPVDLSVVTPERIEQIAAMKVDPPLTVDCTVVKASNQPGTGYVLVNVPTSPLAPHQVEGKYMGRGDKTKRYLSDAEVTALIPRRQQIMESGEEILRDFMAADQIQVVRPHLFLVAQPVSHDKELFLKFTGEPRPALFLWQVLHEISVSPEITRLIDPLARPRISREALREVTRTADGLMAAAEGISGIEPRDRERWTQALEIREDGGLRYYDSNVGGLPEDGGIARRAPLYLDLVLEICREFLAVARDLSAHSGFAGSWQVGVGLTHMYGAYPAQGGGIRRESFAGYSKDSYEQVTGTTVRELEVSPGRIAERLLGRLHRSLSSQRRAQAFTDVP